MTKQKSGGLGRGLGSILPDINLESVKPAVDTICTVPVAKVTANPFQPRKEFDEETLEELAQSIRQQGVITPITVRRMPDDTYQLIAGERRWRASQRAGLKEIPAYVRAASDNQMMEMALVENIQRENLNAMEVALAYRSLIEECRLTHEELSEKMGKNRSTITNYLRLLNLPAETQLALSNDLISMAHARALAGVEDITRHLEILHTVIDRHLSVHETEQMVKSNGIKAKAKATVRRRNDLPESHSAAQNRLKERLQSTVEIKRSQRGKGTLTISFNSDKDFERIMALLEK
ncbi:MAG: ParB/RepB/Spo0J family partition protein [Bacteroidales bacterium]|nr:ParB/RepB/Spo0J family partition protein [Bacteroidales bacterium]MBR5093183.1 ParB/RepB/Spo0J family partition protein [Bacteroidales bacterium]